MKWLGFLNGSTKEELAFGKSSSSRSHSNTTSGEFGMRRSGSDFMSGFNSQTISDLSSDSGRSPSRSFSQRLDNLRSFTIAELKAATKNFSQSLMVGEGGFGCVYKGVMKSTEVPHKTIEVAVKQLNRKGLQGHKEWLMELNVLRIADHPNLVKLIGYCAEDDERGIQRLLVYEFMPNRSVDDHLSTRSAATLSWPMRLKVALNAAQGLTYLHEEMDHPIIFRDFKTSNILLDEQWNAKLSDFGLARQGPMDGLSHVSTAVVGTLGYAAPEYLQTGRLTVKSDIWSYGVVLYELITGRRPIDRDRPKGEQKLLEWVKPYVFDPKRLHMIIDPRLNGKYSLRSVHRLSKVANNCLRGNPKKRPKISEVLEMVKQIVENTDMGNPEQPLIGNPAKEEALSNREKLEKKKGGGRGKDGLDLKEKLKKRLNFKGRMSGLKGMERWWIRLCFWNPKGAVKR